jgi:two-component system, cell cycle sensor histidine kinase and response regulator CckA
MEKGSIARGTETVLVVDDNDEARQALCRTLEWHGYTVLETGVPEQAYAISRVAGRTIDLLLTDIVMPEKTGVDLAKEVAKAQPELRILFISGYTDNEVSHDIAGTMTGFLEKPITINQLSRKVREMLDAPA